MKIIQDDKEFTLSYKEEEEMIFFVWKPVLFSQDRFKEIITNLANVIAKLSPKKMYVNAIENKVIMFAETQAWHGAIIVPKYSASGLKKIAFIIPSSIFSEISHVNLFSKNNADAKLETRFFKTEPEVFEWLND